MRLSVCCPRLRLCLLVLLSSCTFITACEGVRVRDQVRAVDFSGVCVRETFKQPQEERWWGRDRRAHGHVEETRTYMFLCVHCVIGYTSAADNQRWGLRVCAGEGRCCETGRGRGS